MRRCYNTAMSNQMRSYRWKWVESDVTISRCPIFPRSQVCINLAWHKAFHRRWNMMPHLSDLSQNGQFMSGTTVITVFYGTMDNQHQTYKTKHSLFLCHLLWCHSNISATTGLAFSPSMLIDQLFCVCSSAVALSNSNPHPQSYFSIKHHCLSAWH